MKFEKSEFEEHGLKFDKDRVLTYSQLSCPLNCRYCFVDDLNFNQQRGVAYLSEKQFELIDRLPDEIKLIMLGCDTEFLQYKKEALAILERLAQKKRDISVITKLTLSKEYIRRLKEIAERVSEQGNILAFSVSILCTDSAGKWEPKVPNPEKRIETLRRAFDAGIKTLVALRPLLPTLSDEELEEVVAKTKDCCFGFYSGPLYLKSLEHPLLTDLSGLKIEKLQPHWMPQGNIFYRIEKSGQMELLKQILQRYNKPLFEGAAEGIKYLKTI
ncbi:MAG: radical SAM protein [Candidatus Falkowbacteria bacterium]